MRVTLSKLFEHPGAEAGEPPPPWYRSIWMVPIPAILLSVVAIFVLLRNAP